MVGWPTLVVVFTALLAAPLVLLTWGAVQGAGRWAVLGWLAALTGLLVLILAAGLLALARLLL